MGLYSKEKFYCLEYLGNPCTISRKHYKNQCLYNRDERHLDYKLLSLPYNDSTVPSMNTFDE